MKKIYLNNTRHAFSFGKTLLLPGSNACEAIDPKLYPSLAALLESGELEETADTARAARMANTQKAADAIAALGRGDAKTRDAVSRRKRQLDELDGQAEEASKKTEQAEG